MKNFCIKFLFTTLINLTYFNGNSQSAAKLFIQKAIVSKADSSIVINADIKLDHRIFGYNKPDTNSKKMILISVFTNDVEGNPYNCPLGSYYDTYGMGNISLKYLSKKGNFVKANVLYNGSIKSTVYFLRKWIRFEK